MPTTWSYYQDQELPSWAGLWKDGTGTALDLSSGYTFRVQLVNQSTGVVALTKTTGITGYAAGGTYNVTVAWAAGDLNLTPNNYRLILRATSSGSDRYYNPGDPPLIAIKATVS